MLKFYFDEHVAHAVATGLRRRGIDVVIPAEIGMLSATDEEHLERANAEGCVMFTADSDYLALHNAGWPHAGIFYRTMPMSIGEQIRLLAAYHDVYESYEMVGQVEYLR